MSKVPYKGYLVNGIIHIKEDFEKLYKQGYGEIFDNELEIHPLEAAYLVWSQRIEVLDEEGRSLDLKDLLSMILPDPSNFLKYIVYSDLRRRNRVVVYERATEFLRLYPRGASIGEASAKQLILSLSEDQPMPHSCLLDSLEKAVRLRKELILAVVDDEMNVTYYTAEKFIPKPRESYINSISFKHGVLIGDRVLVFDDPGELYAKGFWGHPIGIAKPEPFKVYNSPLQLSLVEALYLVSKGKMEVREPKGDVLGIEELRRRFSQVRDNSRIKEVVHNYWRDMGYVPKAGSKYGVDYIIYERGPGLEHAPYLCIASPLDGKVRPVDLIRAGRLATSVRKELVVSLVSDDEVLNYRVKWFKP
ncbi:MAG: tRNA-intron lyase [Candidatus Korarchaeum sp.]|nr:tRNA-intron lyase [Candidatus Korarchaeum sp.]MDW8035935.1 tRNA-intron lyase [Candidatus Korarchaeum sp.]